MKKRFYITLLVILTFIQVFPAYSDLVRYKAVYEKNLEEIILDYIVKINKLNTLYVNALDKLMQTATKAGELENVMAVKKELERFKKKKNVPSKAEGKLQALNNLQNSYRAQLKNAEIANAKSIVSLSDKYKSALEQIKKEKTIKGDIDEALKIRSELEKLEENEDLIKARKIVSEIPKPDKPKIKTVAKPVEAKKLDPPTAKDIEESKKTRNKCKVYRGRKPPRVTSVKRSLTTVKLIKHPLAGKVSVTAEIQLIKNGTETKDRDTITLNQRIPRLTIKAGDVPLGDCTLVYEYFSSGKGGSCKKIRNEIVSLENIEARETLFIDPIGHRQITKHMYRYPTSGYTYERVPEGGYDPDLYGFAVSIFDGNDDLIFQRVSIRNVADYISASIPK
ncbi:hypothetical protein ACFLS1_08880 [Verrucomicrobiota bacterium]